MPLYLRKDQSWTPTSLTNESFTLDDGDFIQDPDLCRDHLPQPYRLIDKVLTRVLDTVWEHVSHREEERIADASRFRPPQYECGLTVQDDSSTLSRTECVAVTTDGDHVIVGLQNGLAAVNAETNVVADVLTDDNQHTRELQTCRLADGKQLIVALDDMGAAKIYAFAGNQLYYLTTLSDPDSSNKMIVSKFEVSSSGEFVALFLEKPSSQEGLVEVIKLPRDSWIKDLDNLASKAAKLDTSQITNKSPGPDDSVLDKSRTSEPNDQTADKSFEATQATTEDNNRTQARLKRKKSKRFLKKHKTPDVPRTSHSFSSATAVFKVMPPSELSGASYSSVSAACKSVDTQGDVVGTGAHHLLTESHISRREAAFTAGHHGNAETAADAQEQTTNRSPTMHFLSAGRMSSRGSDTKSGDTASLALWWSDTTQLLAYNVHKTTKDSERKPDLVIPVSSRLVASCVSPDGSQVALSTDNNNLMVWDMYLGCPKGVCHLSEGGAVTSLTFLDPSICPQPGADYPPYPMATRYYVLVAMDDGHVRLVDSGAMGAPPVTLDLNIVKSDERPSLYLPVNGIPELLLTCRHNGSVYLHDIHRGNQICEVVLPPDYQLTSPWQPVIAVGAQGGMLYLKGEPRHVPSPTPEIADPLNTQEQAQEDSQGAPEEVGGAPDEERAPEEVPVDSDGAPPQEAQPSTAAPVSRLFGFTLRSFPTLDKYRSRERVSRPYVVQSTVTERANLLLSHRLSEQPARVSRLANRWDRLRGEVQLLEQLREQRLQKPQRNSHTASTIAKSLRVMSSRAYQIL